MALAANPAAMQRGHLLGFHFRPKRLSCMTMQKSCAWFLLTSMAAFGGCGAGGQKQASASKKAPIAVAPVVQAKAELTQINPPKDLIAVARIEHLDNASATIARWMSLPFDLRMLDTLGPGLSRTLMLGAPVEAAVALAEGSDTEVLQPYAVFSAPISSVDAGRAMFEKFGRKLQVLSPEVWITTDESPVTCAVAPALGRAPVRLVCGDRRVDVENLLPYATRGLPLLAMGSSDLHAELRLTPIRERYGQRLRQAKAVGVPMALGWMGISDTRLSRPITDILYALGDEFVDVMDDLDRISINAQVAAAPDRIDISTSFGFTRSRSWFAQAVADSAKRGAPAPAAFFELPNDSGAATYMAPSNPRLFESIAHRLEALVDGGLAHLEVNQKLRDDFGRSLDQYANLTWGGACGQGEPGSNSDVSTATKTSELVAMNEWQICNYDAMSPSIVVNFLESAGKLIADKKVEQLLGAGSVSLKRRAANHGLPTGSSVFDLRINTKALESTMGNWGSKPIKSEKQSNKRSQAGTSSIVTLHIYVVPDANRTWVGSGTDAKAIEAHLAAARKSGGPGHLTSATDLSWLRETPAVAGGFVSLAHFGALLAARMGQKGLSKNRVDEALAVAPHHGKNPIPFTVQVRGDSNAPELWFNTRLDKAIFEDLVAVGGQSLMKKVSK